MEQRRPFDLAAYAERSQRGPCFVCASLADDPAYPHHEVYADDVCVAFLNRYPTLRGYTLVAPRRHVVDVTGDRELFDHLTSVVYEVAEALKRPPGVLDLSDDEQAGLAHTIRSAYTRRRA